MSGDNPYFRQNYNQYMQNQYQQAPPHQSAGYIPNQPMYNMNPTYVSNPQPGGSKNRILPPCQVQMMPNNQGYAMPQMQQMPNQIPQWGNAPIQQMPIQQYSQAVGLPNHGMPINSPNNIMPQMQQQPQQPPSPQPQQPPLQQQKFFEPPPTVMYNNKKDLSQMEKYKEYIVDLSDYNRENVLGSGSFGTVYKAQNKFTGWSVAVKELNATNLPQKQLEFFKREVMILIQCNNPFLLDFVGFSAEPKLSIITNFMQQGSLWDILHKYPENISPTQKTNIAIGIAHGMRYLHSKGIIHRDLKSPNILLDNRLFPYISDFGLGRIIEKAIEGLPPMTTCAGTPNWMAPEQISTENYGFAVDVYSFGMILYELATCRFPFEGLKSHEIFNLVSSGRRPELPPNLEGTPLKDLIQRCWDQDPNKRPNFDQIYNMFYMRNVDFPGTSDSGVNLMIHYIHRHETTINVHMRSNIINEVITLRKKNNSNTSSDSNLSVHSNPSSNSNLNTKSSSQILIMCANTGNIEEFFYYFLAFADSDVNCKDPFPGNMNRTPLHCAAYNGHLAMVEFLTLIDGINVNLVDDCLDTPLSISVQLKQKNVVQILINCPGIDPNIANKYGATPLHYAVVMQEPEIVRILLSSPKIDLTKKDLNGHTAYDMAIQKGGDEITKMLSQAMKNEIM